MQSLPIDRLLRISRPRFWIYVLGPFLIGTVGAAQSLDELRPHLVPWLAFALFFTLPANLLIYGVNDMFDYETDKDNPKKQGYEALVLPKEHRPLLIASLVLCLPFVLLAVGLAPKHALLALAIFFALAIFYSSPPIRAKAVPGIDSVFNALYVFPGVFGYFLVGGAQLPWRAVSAGVLWCMAMHAYSAVPDITTDAKNGIRTIATTLGARATLLGCLAAYLGSSLLAYPSIGAVAPVLGGVYAALIIVSLATRDERGLLQVYAAFPTINLLAGAAVFWRIAWHLL